MTKSQLETNTLIRSAHSLPSYSEYCQNASYDFGEFILQAINDRRQRGLRVFWIMSSVAYRWAMPLKSLQETVKGVLRRSNVFFINIYIYIKNDCAICIIKGKENWTNYSLFDAMFILGTSPIDIFYCKLEKKANIVIEMRHFNSSHAS